MQEQLFEYQKIGADWLKNRKVALLADEMGLGKSAQAIHAADALSLHRILVICPAVARVNWEREFNRWSSLFRQFLILFKKSDRPSLQSGAICSFEYATENAEILKESLWDLLIIDEVHFLKSATAKRTASIFGKKGVVHAAKRTWILSGTPAPNHAGELWTILYLFGATKLPYDAFIERYCTTLQTGYAIQIIGTKKERIPELKVLLSKIMLRRRKMDVLKQLPPIFFTDLTVTPGYVDIDIQASFTQYIFPHDRRDELKEILKNEEKALETVMDLEAKSKNTLKMLEGLATSVSTLRRYVGLQKVAPVVELVKGELNLGLYEKIVIFAIHRDVIEGLRTGLRDYGAVTLYGGTALETRQRNIDKFQKHNKTQVFIGNIAASGTNVTLTAAHQVLFVEQDWVPGNNAQAAMRCHRIGQKEPVTVRFVSISHSLDERVTQVLKRKTKELAEIFES